MINNTIGNMIDTTVNRLLDGLKSSEIIGEPIVTADKTVIIPVMKVRIGFISGGGEYTEKSTKGRSDLPMAGGGGAITSVTPIGFMINRMGEQRFLSCEGTETASPWSEIFDTIVGSILEK